MLLFVSCKKHSDYIAPTDNQIVTQIIIGDTTNMVVAKLNENALVGFRYGDSTYDLDIDGNGEKDVQFFGSRNQMMALGNWSNVQIKCLSNNIKLCSYPYPDSIFISNERSERKENGVVKIYNYINYLCQRKNKDDLFKSLTSISLIPLSEKDILNVDDQYNNANFEIRRKYISYPIDFWLYYKSKDTLIYKITTQLTGCHYFPANDTAYVGFNIQENQRERLGWIKISIKDGHETTILETALHK